MTITMFLPIRLLRKAKLSLQKMPKLSTIFDFINPNDVEILNADTTQIRVSRAYLDEIKTKVNKNDVLSIWRSIDTPPFIRKVSNVSANGKDAILTTTQGTLADLIEHGDFKLSTELYVNYGEKGLKNRYSKDGVYHPAWLSSAVQKTMAKSMQQPKSCWPKKLHGIFSTRME